MSKITPEIATALREEYKTVTRDVGRNQPPPGWTKNKATEFGVAKGTISSACTGRFHKKKKYLK